MAKATGPRCNLQCRYCFYLEKHTLYPQTQDWAMADDVLENFVRQYIVQQQAETITFTWQGGEPTLLGVDYFRKIVALQKKYANGKRIENGLQTNGVLLDDAWADFLAENHFLVGLSIDGPSDLHDRFRVNQGGRPTLSKVLRGLNALKERQVDFNTLTVVHADNGDYPRRVYRFLQQIGSRVMQFIPLVRPAAPGSATPDSVAPEQFGRFLCTVFDIWVRRDVGRTYVQTFDVALESWLGREQSLCAFRPTCGQALAVEHNGDLYSCDHYVDPTHRLGNIQCDALETLVGGERQRRFGAAKRDALPPICRRCEFLFACNGECPKNRIAVAPDGTHGWNYLCAGYRRFFAHIAPAMRFMADELTAGRPPANVMARLAPSPGRNDPCPCGSGRKYKHCCARN